MDIRTKIKNTKVGRPKTIPITPEVNEAYYRTAASRLNREIKGTKKPMYSIRKDSYRALLIIIKNY
jgi:hypothetical protein